MTYILGRKRQFKIVTRRRFPPKVGERKMYTREGTVAQVDTHDVNYEQKERNGATLI